MKKVALLLAVLMILLIAGFAQSAEDIKYEQALEHYTNGDFKKTISILKGYVQQNPKPEAYFMIAYSHYKLNQHEKANKYFNDLFLIDPDYSPTPALIEAGKWPPEGIVIEAAEKREKPTPTPITVKPVVEEPTAQPTPGTLAVPTPPVTKAAPPPPSAVPSPPVTKAAPPPPSAIPSPPVTKAAPPPPPAAPSPRVTKAVPKPPLPSLIPFQTIPETIPEMPFSPVILIAIFAVIWIILCLPFFLIARKLNVPGAWTAWFPILQVWAILKSADKPLWWVLLMLVPFVNLFIYIYIFMCIAENLGKNKWLGLLILVPVIQLLFPYYLAFSKVGSAHEEALPEEFGLDQEPELDIGDTSFLDEEEPEPLTEEPAPAGEEPSFFEEESEPPAEEPEAPATWDTEPEEEPEPPTEEPEAPSGWGSESEEDEPLAWGKPDEDETQ
jgi:hypothetical protein